MAEKKKYNSILISGRKDQTLTYSKYVKDEESGESVKESLDKKVNITDELTTQQIKDGAITNEKMAADSVGNTNLQDGSVSNEKLEDGSITNEKLAENSITKEKLKDNTIGVEKLDPELRQTINAATGLPENLVETIQNVDDTLKDHQKQLDDKQSQIDDKQKQITANDEDISLLQTRSTQMEETIKSIAATGGASQATAVTYNNEKSKLTAVNIQSAVDEVVDKTAIKNEEGTVVETPFRYIQNEEFIFAVVDAENRILAGIKYDAQPYFPNNEMYSVITNEEWIYAIIDADNKVLCGFRADDGHMVVGGIDISTFITNAIIDIADIKERTNHLSTIENDEYLSVETDAEGKVLGYIAPDGSHYLYKVKSETIPTEFEHIEDPEGRTEITTDADNKVLGYRDSEGTRHEHKISAKHIELSDEAAKEVNDAFKSAGIKMENPSDFSKDSYIELPIPRIAAQVRLYAPNLPTTKQDDIEAEIEYNDKDGNYFRKPVILNAQGISSMNYYVKNMAIDINDGSKIKFGDFPTQDSFHLKKYYIDAFRGQCIVGYWLMEQVYKSRPIGQQYPYEYSYSNESTTDGLGDVKKDFFTGAKCHPDGFPINITWINTQDDTETDMGIYAWNLKKSNEVYYADKKKAENIILDGEIAADTLFGGTIKWDFFEIRNPKSLIDIEGNKYDGDHPKELSDTDPFSKKVKGFLVNFSKCQSELSSQKTKTTFEKYFMVAPFIDYVLLTDIVFNNDGLRKNWIWVTYNGLQFTPTAYDLDSIFGSHWLGLYVSKESATYTNLYTRFFPCNILYELYKEQIELRYKELRDLNIFSVTNIINLLKKWVTTIGYDNYRKEFEIYKETPSYRNSYINAEWEFIGWNMVNSSTYNPDTTYNKGDICVYAHCEFKAKKEVSAIPPLSKMYANFPYGYGMYNSIERVANWLEKKIETLDIFYNYKSN